MIMAAHDKDILIVDGKFFTVNKEKDGKVKQLNKLMQLGKMAKIRMLLSKIENEKSQISFYTGYIQRVYAAIERILREEG